MTEKKAIDKIRKPTPPPSYFHENKDKDKKHKRERKQIKKDLKDEKKHEDL